jgi:hypothetical protein
LLKVTVKIPPETVALVIVVVLELDPTLVHPSTFVYATVLPVGHQQNPLLVTVPPLGLHVQSSVPIAIPGEQ